MWTRFWEESGAGGASDHEYRLAHRLTEGVLPLPTGLRTAGRRPARLGNVKGSALLSRMPGCGAGGQRGTGESDDGQK
jgi:hypothetical protein